MAEKWDFTADSDIQKELANKLYTAADNFDSKVNQMYTQVDSMGSNQAWVGEDYDLFKLGCDGYKGAMKDLGDSFRMYGKHFDKIGTGTEELATTLISLVQNMTYVEGENANYLDALGFSSGNGETSSSTGVVDTIQGIAEDVVSIAGSTLGTTPIGAVAGTVLEQAAQLQNNGTTAGTQTYTDSGFTEAFSSNSYWQNIGQDYATNYDFSGANSAFDYAWEAVGGSLETVVDAAQTVGNGAFDGVNDVLEGVQWVLNGHWDGYESDTPQVNEPGTFTNPYDNAYWNNLGDDFAENYDYSGADSAFDYVWETVGGTVETVWDGIMVPVNAVADTGQLVLEGVEWAWNGILDFIS